MALFQELNHIITSKNNLMEILNSFFLHQLYPEGFDFQNSFIRDIHFNSDSPSIFVFFHSSNFPNPPPSKWFKDSNHVKVEIEFNEVSNLYFEGWGIKNIINFSCEKENDTYNVKMEGEECIIRFTTKWIFFKSISGYPLY